MTSHKDLPILYAITDDKLLPGNQLFKKVEDTLKAGCRLIQYRCKDTNVDTVLQAQALLKLTQAYSARLVINDDVVLAKKIKADGVHLGQKDTKIHEARALLGPSSIIGATCHNSLSLAKNAIESGASYVAFGRFFPSQTKPEASLAELDLIKKAKAQLDSPVVVIGGITLNNAQTLVKAGADSLAVCYDLFSNENIPYRTQQFLSLKRTVNYE